MRIIRSLVCVLLAAAMLVCMGCAAAEETDLAHEIWYAMAEAGQVDMRKAWEFMGMYTFGETTGDGYVTLTMTEDGQKISGNVTFRIYPKSTADITEQFCPMLDMLLNKLYGRSEENSTLQFAVIAQDAFVQAWLGGMDTDWGIVELVSMNMKLQYDADNNELYCMITPTENTPGFAVKE